MIGTLSKINWVIYTEPSSDFCTTYWCSTIYSRYISQQVVKKLSSIVSKLSAKRFAKLHSDWPKLLLGSQALVRGHRNSKCVLHHTPMVGQ